MTRILTDYEWFDEDLAVAAIVARRISGCGQASPSRRAKAISGARYTAKGRLNTTLRVSYLTLPDISVYGAGRPTPRESESYGLSIRRINESYGLHRGLDNDHNRY